MQYPRGFCLDRPVLVGWSHGATLAVRYAARHPEQVTGLVLVDGAYPITMLDAAARAKAHAQFRRIGWMMRILAAFGRSARMSPDQAADVTIEVDQVSGELGPEFAALRDDLRQPRPDPGQSTRGCGGGDRDSGAAFPVTGTLHHRVTAADGGRPGS
jgi:pimeloyl-ACP methyl ester carboxylesterase